MGVSVDPSLTSLPKTRSGPTVRADGWTAETGGSGMVVPCVPSALTSWMVGLPVVVVRRTRNGAFPKMSVVESGMAMLPAGWMRTAAPPVHR